MPPIDFTPAHAQPFTLEQAMQLEVDTLAKEVARLQNSIAHLQRTQGELEEFLAEEGEEGDEDGELRKAVQENKVVIASQNERITLIKVALLNKVGEGGMKHYGYDDSPDPDKTSSQSTSNTAIGTNSYHEEEGVYL